MSYGAAIPGVKIKFSDIQNLSVFSIPKFQTELFLVYGVTICDGLVIMEWMITVIMIAFISNNSVVATTINILTSSQLNYIITKERNTNQQLLLMEYYPSTYLLIHIFGGGLLWTTPRQGEDLYLLNNVPMQFPEVTMTIIISLFA